MFKYMIVLALALVVVMAAPPAPEAPKDLNTANQLLYNYGYPTVYSSGYAAYPAYTGYGYGYAYPGYNYGGLRVVG